VISDVLHQRNQSVEVFGYADGKCGGQSSGTECRISNNLSDDFVRRIRNRQTPLPSVASI